MMDDAQIKLVGAPCGFQSSCNLYKTFRYIRKGKKRKLSLGEHFFVQILEEYPVAIGELHLLWEDKSATPLCSLRAYFLPEHTHDGRQSFHGDDEVLAVSDKIVLRLDDLVPMIRDGVSWGIGSVPYCDKTGPKNGVVANGRSIPGCKRSHDTASTSVHIVSYMSYCRYRTVMKRLDGCVDAWIHDSLVHALGALSASAHDSRLLFCRDDFDFPELDNLDIRCDHLLPVPRTKTSKRKSRSSQDSGESNDECNSDSSYQPPPTAKVDPSEQTAGCADVQPTETDLKRSSLRNGLLRSKASSDEAKFLSSWKKFMKAQNTPVDRIPSLGFKQIDVYFFYMYGKKLGGYSDITKKRLWKHLYDRLGGDPRNTSAATCTRRHYERLLLPYECYMKGVSVPKKKEKRNLLLSVEDPRNESVSCEKTKTDIEVQRILDNIHTSAKLAPRMENGAEKPVLTDNNFKHIKPMAHTIKSVMEKIAVSNAQENNNFKAKSKRRTIQDCDMLADKLGGNLVGAMQPSMLAPLMLQKSGAIRPSLLAPLVHHKLSPDQQQRRQNTNDTPLVPLCQPTSSTVTPISHASLATPSLPAAVALPRTDTPPQPPSHRPSVIHHAPSHPSQLTGMYAPPIHAHHHHSHTLKTPPAHQLKRTHPGYIEQNYAAGPAYDLPQLYHDHKRPRVSSSTSAPQSPHFYLSQMKNLAHIQRTNNVATVPTSHGPEHPSLVAVETAAEQPTDLSMHRVTPQGPPDDSVGLDLSMPKKLPKTDAPRAVPISSKLFSSERTRVKTSPAPYDLSLAIPHAHSTKLINTSLNKKGGSTVAGNSSSITSPSSTNGLLYPAGLLSPTSPFIHPAFPLSYLPSSPLPPILPQTLSPMDIQKLYETQVLRSNTNQMAAYHEMLKTGFYSPLGSPFLPVPPTSYPSTSNQQSST